MNKIEQLNIGGKRSGKGFVAHKAVLVDALSRGLADRVSVSDITVGRKGLLAYLKSLSGSNIIKVIPDGETIKVSCGSHAGTVNDSDWIGENTPMTICEVKVSPHHVVQPNIGAGELADALMQTLPFTATEDTRPTLQCVKVIAGDGKLILVSADGYTLSEVRLDYTGEGEALINRADLIGVANALRKAKRANIAIEASGEGLDGTALVIDTEVVTYRFNSFVGQFPDYGKLIPSEFNTYVSMDSAEALQAVRSLVALSGDKDTAIDIAVAEGLITLSNPDDKGSVTVHADTTGDGDIRANAQYLLKVFRACQGMIDLSISEASSPMLFSLNGNKVVVMPMAKPTSRTPAEAETEATETETPAEKPRARRSRAKEPVAV